MRLARSREGIGNRITTGWVVTYALMILLVAFTSLPLVYLLVSAFKPLDELVLYPPRFFVRRPTVEGFLDLFTALDSQEIPFTRYLFNSLFTTSANVLLIVLISTMGAYGLDKIKLPGGRALFRIVILGLMFSPPAAQIPIYMAINSLGILDTYWALIIPKLATPMFFFLLKQFMSQVPLEMVESARMDGAGEFGVYRRIVLPMIKPAIATVVVFAFIDNWNDAGPSTIYITRQAMRTLPFALGTIFSGGVIARLAAQNAAALLTILPTILLYLVMQSKVIRTMAYSGLKG